MNLLDIAVSLAGVTLMLAGVLIMFRASTVGTVRRYSVPKYCEETVDEAIARLEAGLVELDREIDALSAPVKHGRGCACSECELNGRRIWLGGMTRGKVGTLTIRPRLRD